MSKSPLVRAPALRPSTDNTRDDASVIQGPTQLPIDANARGGAAPKDHRDAKLTRIAAAETNGEYTAVPDPSNPAKRWPGGGAFLSSTALHGGEE